MRKKPARTFRTEETLLRHLKASLENDFPNPKRIGCPPESLLARHADHPNDRPSITDHVSHCSPCYGLYSHLLREWKAKKRKAKRRKD